VVPGIRSRRRPVIVVVVAIDVVLYIGIYKPIYKLTGCNIILQPYYVVGTLDIYSDLDASSISDDLFDVVTTLKTTLELGGGGLRYLDWLLMSDPCLATLADNQHLASSNNICLYKIEVII